MIRKTLQLSVGKSNALTQPALTATGMSAFRKRGKTPLWKQTLFAKFSELIKPVFILAKRDGHV